MNEKCRAAFDKAGYWPNEIMWKAWQQSWVAATEDIENNAALAYAMLEKRKDSEIERLRAALGYACCGIDTVYADIERDCVEKAKACLTRHSCAAENTLRLND